MFPSCNKKATFNCHNFGHSKERLNSSVSREKETKFNNIAPEEKKRKRLDVANMLKENKTGIK